jgi:hypothetical protein
MKATLALLLLAAVGFAVAGCGSGASAGSGPITMAGTTTVSLKTGTAIRCKGGTGASVPPPGQAVTGFADGRSRSSMVQLVHRQDGSVVVSCRVSGG